MRRVVALLLATLVLGSLIGANVKTVGAAEPKPLNVIIVWHQHQPYYYDPIQDVYTRPWVRLHAANDYWKMAHYLSEYPDVHATIDLSGSLIAQIADYMHGKKDTYQIVTEKIANGEPLTVDEKWFMLQAPGGGSSTAPSPLERGADHRPPQRQPDKGLLETLHRAEG